jgi:hypothetical protein
MQASFASICKALVTEKLFQRPIFFGISRAMVGV